MKFALLTPSRFPDLEALFGPRGACGGCWCMAWRLPRSQFEKKKGPGNKRAFRAVVASGKPPGIIAYERGEPIGWCAVAPRRAYPFLTRSRVLAPVDGEPVWSVSCLFVTRRFRRRGVSAKLLRAAVDFAAKRGAKIVEGYPVEPARKKAVPDVFVWTGLASAFRRAGFVEVARRSATRPIMRRRTRPSPVNAA